MTCAELVRWSAGPSGGKLLADGNRWGICEARVDCHPNLDGGAMSGTGKSKRGFASMDVSRQREIASKGGRAAHQKGTAHEWTSDEARVAGRKCGEVVSRDRAHMAAIGREGGESRGAKNRRRQTAASRGSESSGGAYSDRESPVEVSREGMLGSQSSRSTRDELSDNGMESVRDEDVPNPT